MIEVQSLLFSARDNPDSLQGRAKREKAQFSLEKKLSSLEGTSIIERLVSIREQLFKDFESVAGDKITQVRDGLVSTNYQKELYYYPHPIDNARKWFPSFIRTIDALYDRMLEHKQQQELTLAQALRFASVIYCLGIVIHPYRDGNGQTLRMTALSYLHELHDSFKGKYLSFRKIGQPNTNVTKVVPIRQLRESFDQKQHSKIDQSEMQKPEMQIIFAMQDLMGKGPTNDDRYDFAYEQSEEADPKILAWAKDVRKVIDLYEATKNPDSIGTLNSHASQLPINMLHDALTDRIPLKVQQYLQSAVPTRQVDTQQLNAYLSRLLLDPQSQEDLWTYIVSGEGNSADIMLEIATQIFDKASGQIFELLEEKRQHVWSFYKNRIIDIFKGAGKSQVSTQRKSRLSLDFI